MSINKTCQNVLFNVYFYDFASAYPRLLDSIGINLKSDLTDKVKRNIEIGKLQRDNPKLSSYLIESINNLIRFYIDKNKLTPDDIIVTQRDGFIVRKVLEDSDSFLKLDFRGIINTLIITIDRSKYLSCHEDGVVSVKGVSNYYKDLDIFYKQFFNLCFYNRKTLFKQLDNLKKSVFQNDNIDPFLIPCDEGFYVQMNDGSTIIVKDPSVVDISDIDKNRYFQHYIKCFLDPVFLMFFDPDKRRK